MAPYRAVVLEQKRYAIEKYPEELKQQFLKISGLDVNAFSSLAVKILISFDFICIFCGLLNILSIITFFSWCYILYY